MKPRTRRIFVDTEWTGPPWSARSELMWIGLADHDGRSWYGVSSEVEIDPATNDFVSGAFRLIDPDEPRMSRRALAQAVEEFGSVRWSVIERRSATTADAPAPVEMGWVGS